MSVAVFVHYTMCMRRITLSSVDCLAVDNFFTLSHKRYNFLRKLLSANFIVIFYTHFIWNISHSKKNRTRY